MLRLGVSTNKGPVAVLGIDDGNLQRMKAGMPLIVDLKSLTPPGKRIISVVVHYAHTHEDVVKDMEEGGWPINDEVRAEAKKLDKQRKRERGIG